MDFELDPERSLWKPTRRFFLFGLGASLVAPALPDLPFISEIPPAPVCLLERQIVDMLTRIQNAGSTPTKAVVGSRFYGLMKRQGLV